MQLIPFLGHYITLFTHHHLYISNYLLILNVPDINECEENEKLL